MSDLIIKPSGTSANFKVQNPSGTDKIVMNSSGTITTATLGSGADIKAAINASGTAPIYACRAWVNFNGTGTVAIRASANVSSITDNDTGDYTVNFTTAMEDNNYACLITGVNRSNNSSIGYALGYHTSDEQDASTYTTSSVRFTNKQTNNTTRIDQNPFSVAIFR
mgnify:CR=1 FL=1